MVLEVCQMSPPFVSPATKQLAAWRELFGHQGAKGVLVADDVALRARREGTDDKLVGLSPNPTSTTGGETRQTSKGCIFTSTVF